MSILGRLFGRGMRADAASPAADDYWYQPSGIGGMAQSGAFVTGDTAMRVAAVYACVRVLAESLAMLPLRVFRLGPSGRTKAEDHPLWELLARRPNHIQTPFDFRVMMMGHLALRGNAYGRIIAGPDGVIREVMPLHPDRVRVYRMQDGTLQYQVRDLWSGVLWEKLLPSDILHLRGLSTDGVVGLSPIAVAREVFGGALASQDWSNRLFANNATPGGIIKIPGKTTRETREQVKADWEQRFSGINQHRPAVLDQGADFMPLGMTPEDAQFLQTRQFQATDIARVFRVPPHKIGILDRATHSNIEHQGIEFIQDTMLPWVTAWEQAIERDLMTPQERQALTVSFDLDALLRGDIATRFTAYAIARQWGWMSANDVLRAEGKDPVDGLDEYLRPLNMVDATKPVQMPQPSQKGS